MNVAARRLSFTDRCDDLSSSDRSYSFVTRIRQGVCLRGGKRIQLCPVCTRRTYTILLWAWLYCGRLVRLDHLAATANCIIRVACINFDWMVTCNGFARVGLLKANAAKGMKVKTRTALQSRVLRRIGRVADGVRYIVRPLFVCLFVRSKLVHI